MTSSAISYLNTLFSLCFFINIPLIKLFPNEQFQSKEIQKFKLSAEQERLITNFLSCQKNLKEVFIKFKLFFDFSNMFAKKSMKICKMHKLFWFFLRSVQEVFMIFFCVRCKIFRGILKKICKNITFLFPWNCEKLEIQF